MTDEILRYLSKCRFKRSNKIVDIKHVQEPQFLWFLTKIDRNIKYINEKLYYKNIRLNITYNLMFSKPIGLIQLEGRS